MIKYTHERAFHFSGNKPRKILVALVQQSDDRIHPIPAATVRFIPPFPSYYLALVPSFRCSYYRWSLTLHTFTITNRSNKRYYFRQWGESPFRNKLFSFFFVTRILGGSVMPPPRGTRKTRVRKKIGGACVCLSVGTMVVAGSKVQNFCHVATRVVEGGRYRSRAGPTRKVLGDLTRASWRWAAFQTIRIGGRAFQQLRTHLREIRRF